MGSVTGTVIAAFMISFGKEYLRFFDATHSIGGWQIPIFRPGLRMVIFSLILMAVVLFWRRGLMGRKEFSWDGIYNFLRKWPWRLKKFLRGDYKAEGKIKRKTIAAGKAIDSAATKSKRAGIKAGKTADREKKKEVKADAE